MIIKLFSSQLSNIELRNVSKGINNDDTDYAACLCPVEGEPVVLQTNMWLHVLFRMHQAKRAGHNFKNQFVLKLVVARNLGFDSTLNLLDIGL